MTNKIENALNVVASRGLIPAAGSVKGISSKELVERVREVLIEANDATAAAGLTPEYLKQTISFMNIELEMNGKDPFVTFIHGKNGGAFLGKATRVSVAKNNEESVSVQALAAALACKKRVLSSDGKTVVRDELADVSDRTYQKILYALAAQHFKGVTPTEEDMSNFKQAVLLRFKERMTECLDSYAKNPFGPKARPRKNAKKAEGVVDGAALPLALGAGESDDEDMDEDDYDSSESEDGDSDELSS